MKPRREPTADGLARDRRGRPLASNFSTQRSARTYALQHDLSPPELLQPRRYTPSAEPIHD